MSSSTSAMARAWSSVSAKGKRAQNSSQAPSAGVMEVASRRRRSAAVRIRAPAMSWMRCFIFALRVCQPAPPSLSRDTPWVSEPKRLSSSMFSTGRNSFSSLS